MEKPRPGLAAGILAALLLGTVAGFVGRGRLVSDRQRDVPDNPEAAPALASPQAVHPRNWPSPAHSGVASSASTQPNLAWPALESADYATYIRNLRVVGCPEPTVRDIVTADLKQAYAPRRAEAVARCYGDVHFWQTGEPWLTARTQLAGERRVIDGEFAGALQDLLGADMVAPAADTEWRKEELKHQLAFLAEDQRASVEAVLLRTADLEPQIKALADGQKLTEDPASLQSIWADYEAKRDRLHQLLTPEQYEEMELNVSWTADNLRRAMAHFDPTEQEFREIFRAWRAHDEDLAQRAVSGLPDPGNAHVFEQIRAVLGDERFHLYRETWWR